MPFSLDRFDDDVRALPPITVTTSDVRRLTDLLATRVGLAYRTEARRLRGELRRATVIESLDVPSNVVTMNSTVLYEDATLGFTRSVTLVYPWAARDLATLSVLSPAGTALLGLRAGDGISWMLDDGMVKHFRVLAVPYQPEAAGHWHL